MNTKIYEIMVLLNPVSSDKNASLIKSIKDQFTKVIKTDDWGIKKLAYKVKDNNHGHYVVLIVEATNDELVTYRKKSLVNKDVLRDLVISLEKEVRDVKKYISKEYRTLAQVVSIKEKEKTERAEKIKSLRSENKPSDKNDDNHGDE